MPSKKNIYLLCSIYVQPSQVFCYVWWKWWSSTLSLQSTHRKIWLTMECMFDMKCKMSFLTFQAISKSFWSQIDFILSKWAISKLTWAKWVNFEPNGPTLSWIDQLSAKWANFEPNGQLWAKWTNFEPNRSTLSQMGQTCAKLNQIWTKLFHFEPFFTLKFYLHDFYLWTTNAYSSI